MVAGTKETLSEESQIFTAGWQFMKKYANPKTKEDWSVVAEAAKAFPKNFKNQTFARDMILSILTQIERSCNVL